MQKNKLQLTLCATCVRDNYGEGIFATIDNFEKSFREQLKSQNCSAVEIKHQNCFNSCENYHCVQVSDGQTAHQLKKISNPQKIAEVAGLIKKSQHGKLEIPENLKENFIETVKIN